LDEIEISLQCERWVDTGLMGRAREKCQSAGAGSWGRSSAFMMGPSLAS
jgi:hypothetical protein